MKNSFLSILLLLICSGLWTGDAIAQCDAEGGALFVNGDQTEFSICLDEATSSPFVLELFGNSGINGAWIITDGNGIMTSISETLPTNVEAGGAPICIFYFISYDNSTTGLQTGLNIANIGGCFDLSNPVTGTKINIDGGVVTATNGATTVDLCSTNPGLASFDITLSNPVGSNSKFLVTDADATILAIPTAPPFDLAALNCSNCFIWHLSYEDFLSGAEVGLSAVDIIGCFDLSDPLIVRKQVHEGGFLSTSSGNNLTICTSGNPSVNWDVNLVGNEGENARYVLTDFSLNILAIAPMPYFDLNNFADNFFFLWHLSYEDGVLNFEVGQNAAALGGCFDFSNSIGLTKSSVEGGTLSFPDGTASVTICGSDGQVDQLNPQITGATGSSSVWLITNTDGTILNQATFPNFNYDEIDVGLCQLWFVSHEGPIGGINIGANLFSIDGCYAISNALTINKTGAVGGTINLDNGETNTSICSSNGQGETLNVNSNGAEGPNAAWVVTNSAGIILNMPSMPPFDSGIFPDGSSLIWHVSYGSDVEGLSIGQSIWNLAGCFSLSNAINVFADEVNGGQIMTSSGETVLNFCSEEATPDLLFIILNNHSGNLSSWIITDDNGQIIRTPVGPPFTLNTLGIGQFSIWHMTYDNQAAQPILGQFKEDLSGCHNFSNPIEITISNLEGGFISTLDGSTDVLVCAGDGVPDGFDVNLENNSGPFSAWIITSGNNTIIDMPSAPPFDLGDAGPGEYTIYYLSYFNANDGISVGQNLSELSGCYDLSNPISVSWTGVDGGDLSTEDGETVVNICVTDLTPDTLDVKLNNDFGANSSWLITSLSGTILELPDGPPFYFNANELGACQIRHVSYAEELEGQIIGENISNLEGCFSLSNPLEIWRDSSAVVCMPSAIEDLERTLNIAIFPNPVRDLFEIDVRFDQGVIAVKEVQISTILGESLIQIPVDQKQSFRKEIAISSYPKGVYLISVKTDKGILSKKFIKY